MSKIATAVKAREAAAVQQNPAGASISVMVNSLLDREGYRRRFDDLLGRRAPQFVSSIVSMVSADKNLQEAFRNAPLTVIQSALKAATYDLPIDTALGYAYVVPFRNKGTMEATFLLGYKGMLQLALRTGVYKTINVVDVREGELKRYDRLTEEVEIDFVEDEDEREALPIVGWAGYFRLVNGTEKTIYMTRKQIEAHEKKHRKGQYMGKGWRDDFEAMARKTVLRRLLGTWGIMSIDYQRADAATVAAADAIATGQWDGEDIIIADAEETPQEALTASEEASTIGGIEGMADEPLPWDPEEGIR